MERTIDPLKVPTFIFEPNIKSAQFSNFRALFSKTESFEYAFESSLVKRTCHILYTICRNLNNAAVFYFFQSR